MVRSLLEVCLLPSQILASHSLLEACCSAVTYQPFTVTVFNRHTLSPATVSIFIIISPQLHPNQPEPSGVSSPQCIPTSQSHLACHLPSCTLATHHWRHILPSQFLLNLLSNPSLLVVVHLFTSNLQRQHLQVNPHNHLKNLELLFHRDMKLTVRCKCPQLILKLQSQSLLFLLSLNLSQLLPPTPCCFSHPSNISIIN